MNPADVTDEMADKLRREQCVDWGRKEIIAAAVNAVLGDPTPITAEWLVANGYETDDCEWSSYRKKTPVVFVSVSFPDGSAQVFVNRRGVSTKTIGQLRALEIGLGIKQ